LAEDKPGTPEERLNALLSMSVDALQPEKFYQIFMRKFRAAKEGDGLVMPVKEWNGEPYDVTEFWYEFQLAKLGEILKPKRKTKLLPSQGRRGGPRLEVVTLVERAKQGINLTHRQRLAVVCELLAAGKSDDEIVSIFSKQTDFNESKTRYFVEHARRRGYRPFRLRTLEARP